MNWWQTDETHDPRRKCWVESANRHPDFPIQNLPLGVFSPRGEARRIGVAIGDEILDLAACTKNDLLPRIFWQAARATTLNGLMALPAGERRHLRRSISRLLSDATYRPLLLGALHPLDECMLHMPARIGNYTDFYAGIHHATNVGKLFRPDNPLLPNYKHVPIGYHGRASSVRPSGFEVIRPDGQSMLPGETAPSFGPSKRLDYELELGIWVGPGNPLGHPIPITEAADHVAGYCLLNDWSARDFQAWEYQPLGPFLAKSFHTTISPWVITAEAMAPFRIPQPARPEGDPAPLPYLSDARDQAHGAISLTLEVRMRTAVMRAQGLAPQLLSTTQASNLYWTAHQLVTLHASNGCPLSPGDLLGTGTISAPTPEGFGSLLELTEGGRIPIRLPSGETRTFLEDGDEIAFSATAQADGFVPIRMGACVDRITAQKQKEQPQTSPPQRCAGMAG